MSKEEKKNAIKHYLVMNVFLLYITMRCRFSCTFPKRNMEAAVNNIRWQAGEDLWAPVMFICDK